jgi:putative aldouronate transport system substrate-binding protein
MEEKNMKKAFVILLAMLIAASLFAGGSKDTTTAGASSGGGGPFSYPVPGKPVLSYFGRFHAKVASSYKSYSDLDIVRYWFEKTGVTLDFFTPPAGMETEQLNIMLASGDLTDLIVYNLAGMRGGLQKLYDDKIIVKITDKVDAYMPNMMKFFHDNPHIYRQIKDDDGDLFAIPFLKGGGFLLATSGTMIRDDILRALNIAPPETIDEWERAMIAMKAAHPRSSPYVGDFTMLRNSFMPAYGISSGLWYEDTAHKAHYSPLEPGYREFLVRMNKWYSTGLIDPNFATIDGRTVDNAMSSGAGFATYRAGSSGLGAYLNANKNNPNFSIIGVRQPSLARGEVIKYIAGFEYGGNDQMGITTNCKNIEAAMRMYDFVWSQENYIKFNWGVEGESFTYVNGKPQYTDLILNNPNGLDVDTILAKYALTAIKGPAMLVQDPDYIVQYYNQPQQKQAMEQWMIMDLDNRSFPPVSFTSRESSDFARIMADLETYVMQMTYKFILGTEPFGNWDTFIAKVRRMNAEDAVRIQQTALDRYNRR